MLAIVRLRMLSGEGVVLAPDSLCLVVDVG